MAGLFDSLPGYLKAPIPSDTDLKAYMKRDHTNLVQARSVGFV